MYFKKTKVTQKLNVYHWKERIRKFSGTELKPNECPISEFAHIKVKFYFSPNVPLHMTTAFHILSFKLSIPANSEGIVEY
jgi:hypothetical protein